MKIAGKLTRGANPYTLAADTKRVSRQTMPVAANIVKLSAYMDGGGSGAGTQVVRAVVYDASGNLVASGAEVLLPGGFAPMWVDLPMVVPGGLPVAAADFDLGVHVGATSNVLRIYGDDPGGAGGKLATDTYSDGASLVFGTSTTLTSDLSIFATYVTPWIIPLADEIVYSRLPWSESQAFYGRGSVLAGPRRAITGWHGTLLDPERGANAVVNPDGPLADLLGERLRLTRYDVLPHRQVFVYCHNSEAILDDISLSRRAFLALAPPSTDTALVTVEVLG